MTPHNFKDLSGQRFGKLTVLQKYDVSHGKTRWLCQCDCGNTTISTSCNLNNGNSKSCGCINKERFSKLNLIHGEYNSPLHKKWKQMICRCRPDFIEADSYFKRGITVCDEWKKYIVFKQWALENGYQDGYSIERKDVEKGYSPDNCKWIPLKQQSWNKQNTLWIEYKETRKSLAEWCEILGLNYSKIYKRIHYRHWDIERAFTTP